MRLRKNMGVWIVCFLSWIIFCGAAWAAQTESSSAVKAQVAANNAFAWDLYAKLQTQPGNLFFSPYSIATALAMPYAGAQGATAAQMAQTLHLTLKPKALHPAIAALAKHFQAMQKQGDVTLNVANALWVEKDSKLRKGFAKLMKTYYGANVFPVKFKEAAEQVRLDVNAWVAKATNDKIKDVIAPGVFDKLTRLALTNVIYFQGNWHSPFQEKLTRETPFWLTAEKTIPVPMMNQSGTFAYQEDDMLQVVSLPYAGKDLALCVLLPRQKDGLPDLEKQLNVENMAKWLALLKPAKVRVTLPKFTLTAEFELAKTLGALGMTAAFTDKADFSGISKTGSLRLSQVIHKAFVEVNEQGTEAAAATAVVITKDGARAAQFNADHPFLFCIYDQVSGAILFVGRVVNPQG